LIGERSFWIGTFDYSTPFQHRRTLFTLLILVKHL